MKIEHERKKMFVSFPGRQKAGHRGPADLLNGQREEHGRLWSQKLLIHA